MGWRILKRFFGFGKGNVGKRPEREETAISMNPFQNTTLHPESFSVSCRKAHKPQKQVWNEIERRQGKETTFKNRSGLESLGEKIVDATIRNLTGEEKKYFLLAENKEPKIRAPGTTNPLEIAGHVEFEGDSKERRIYTDRRGVPDNHVTFAKGNKYKPNNA